MKTITPILLTFFLFTSCFVIKVYENDVEEISGIEPRQLRKEMIRSGKVIELPSGKKSELLFYGEDHSPVDSYFLQDSIVFKPNDSIGAKEISNIGNRSIFKSNWNCPVVILNGKVIANDSLEIIFIEGEEALTKYGDEAQNGAVELFISD
tara:strand:- start:814 stop:1266 length:453 start_codon:yes stop_codon:yes gene_type:complete